MIGKGESKKGRGRPRTIGSDIPENVSSAEYQRLMRIKNPGKYREYQKRWREKNKKKWNEMVNRYMDGMEWAVPNQGKAWSVQESRMTMESTDMADTARRLGRTYRSVVTHKSVLKSGGHPNARDL